MTLVRVTRSVRCDFTWILKVALPIGCFKEAEKSVAFVTKGEEEESDDDVDTNEESEKKAGATAAAAAAEEKVE